MKKRTSLLALLIFGLIALPTARAQEAGQIDWAQRVTAASQDPANFRWYSTWSEDKAAFRALCNPDPEGRSKAACYAHGVVQSMAGIVLLFGGTAFAAMITGGAWHVYVGGSGLAIPTKLVGCLTNPNALLTNPGHGCDAGPQARLETIEDGSILRKEAGSADPGSFARPSSQAVAAS